MEIYIIEKRLRDDSTETDRPFQPTLYAPIFGDNAKKVAEAQCLVASHENPSFEYQAVSYMPTL